MNTSKVILENVNTGDIIEFEEFEVVDDDNEPTFDEFMEELKNVTKYTDEELFDFSETDDEHEEVEKYYVSDELADFIANFDDEDYKNAILMYANGKSIDEILEHYKT